MSDLTYPTLQEVIKYFPNASHVYVTSTTGGTHSATSYHYKGEAIDVGSASQQYKDELAAWLYNFSSYITELIHTKAGDTGGWYVKNGNRVPHGYYGATIDLAHINHVHLAVATTSAANALLAAVKGSPPAPTGLLSSLSDIDQATLAWRIESITAGRQTSAGNITGEANQLIRLVDALQAEADQVKAKTDHLP